MRMNIHISPISIKKKEKKEKVLSINIHVCQLKQHQELCVSLTLCAMSAH